MKPHSGNKYQVLGTMSGTSLDGLDIAAVEFRQENGKWNFTLKAAETIRYSKSWKEKLKNAPALSGSELIQLHSEYGRFNGQEIKRFIQAHSFTPDLIASHGHTIFHQPDKGYTFQLGHGAVIAAETQITTVADFRSGDVALRGQGAPLVPAGDAMLFSAYEYCLNLGGFANISFEMRHKRIAFDICPVNIILNHFAEQKGMHFDKDGMLGRTGNVQSKLLNKLNDISYYQKKIPKSLGREWLENQFFPVLKTSGFSNIDQMRTVYEHIAVQISRSVAEKGKILVTGGGTFNDFLIERIEKHAKTKIVIPEAQIINYKEAIIFAFLGLLKSLEKINCYASVTGARSDSSTGIIFLSK